MEEGKEEPQTMAGKSGSGLVRVSSARASTTWFFIQQQFWKVWTGLIAITISIGCFPWMQAVRCFIWSQRELVLAEPELL
jgi:hypothetical protein